MTSDGEPISPFQTLDSLLSDGEPISPFFNLENFAENLLLKFQPGSLPPRPQFKNSHEIRCLNFMPGSLPPRL